jgi:uncharacterized membrane protein YeaQ/YmgE (transglycosylase-associated protein family)
MRTCSLLLFTFYATHYLVYCRRVYRRADCEFDNAYSLGFVGTTLLGIVGSVIGGLIARLFSKPPAGSKFHPAGFLVSILGAIVLVLIAKLIS